MNNAVNLKTHSAFLLRQAATDAWHRRDFSAYFDLMRQAEKVSPDDPGLLLDLGAAYGLRTEFALAEQFFERAVAGSRDKSKMLSKIGFICRDFLRYDLAADYLSRAAQEPGAPAEAVATLAGMKERLRETDAAESAVERALKIDSKCQTALLVRARLTRLEGNLQEAEAIVRTILSRTDRSGIPARTRGWYELAAILDRKGCYDEAIEALATGKNLSGPQASGVIAARKAVHRELAQAARELSSSHFQRWNTVGIDPARRRFALIAGHPRSGTTLLEQLVDAHSAVVSAEETEIFFDTYYELVRDPSRPMIPMLDSLSESAIKKARESYFRRMDLFISTPVGDRVLIDKNPALTGLIPGILRIIPQAKHIVALRDPRDVCLSCFMQHLDFRYLTMKAAVEEYCSLMGFWLAIKPLLPTPTLEIRYEDVVTDMRSEAEKALQFLGLEWEPAILNFNEHARHKLIRSPTYAEVARPISRESMGRWKRYRKHLEPYLDQLAPLVGAFGYESS